MDYGKWKYAQKKKEQKARSHAKQSELKGIRLRPKIDIHDLEIKMSKAREFLIDGDKVQFTMLFRGREMAHRNLGLDSMRKICDESEPKMMGRRATMVLAPDRKSSGKVTGEPGAPKREPAEDPQTAEAH
jgi:translation initiation factor IF-3